MPLPEPQTTTHQSTRKVGTVMSAAMDKTIVVQVEYRKQHPRLKKIVKVFSKFYAHDKKSLAKVGDKVVIEETKPLSKLKRWRLVEIQK